MITITAFKWLPPFAQGIGRDLRLRWALEEAGLKYQTRLIGPDDQMSPDYRLCQPFGQVPIFEEEGLVLFESGSILLHIAERSEALFPPDAAGKARAVTWVFAALNSIEIMVQQLGEIDLFWSNEEWAKERRSIIEQMVIRRLADLATWLGDRDYLEGRFTAGDLMMATVLQILRHTNLVAEEPKLKSYLTRCESRPAFQRAFRDHMATFGNR
jgi:glutathione S-transferase